jgi:hypothetical protein
MKEQKGEGKNKKEGCTRGCTGRTVAETVLAGVAAEPICVFLPWPALFFLLFLFFAGTLFFVVSRDSFFCTGIRENDRGRSKTRGNAWDTSSDSRSMEQNAGKNVGLRA